MYDGHAAVDEADDGLELSHADHVPVAGSADLLVVLVLPLVSVQTPHVPV